MADEKLLTQKEACELLDTYPRKFTKEAEKHGIPCLEAGDLKLYRPEDVERLRPHVATKKYRTAASA